MAAQPMIHGREDDLLDSEKPAHQVSTQNLLGYVPNKAFDMDANRKFDFSKVGSSIDAMSSMSTTADGAESIAFSCSTQGFGNGSLGMQSWQSAGSRRKFRHEVSNLSTLSIDEEAEGDEGLDEANLEDKDNSKYRGRRLSDLSEGVESSSNWEPIKIMVTDTGTPSLSSTRQVQDLPSVGSQDHQLGRCKPCAWFWKPGSCSNGKECGHCHLCPEGEIKSRKKAKSQLHGRPGLTEPAFLPLVVQDLEEQDLEEEDQHEQPQPLSQPPVPSGSAPISNVIGELPSRGSALHASGQCRPCGWFHKPQQCSNGTECNHCHLCPEGELKTRKKNTSSTKVQPQAAKGEEVDDVEDPDSQNWSVPPGLLLPIPTAATPSAGSVNHPEDCRPCAWYWKASSCINGKDCLHCHLCPESEIKARKKAKLDAMRGKNSGRADDEEVSSDDEPQQAAPSPSQSQRAGSRGKSPLLELQQALTPASLNQDVNEGDLPSSGSTLHALGKCKPCAWHWKPGGCTNGRECCHCHLCPKEELNTRRKTKENAMRAGALKPAGQCPKKSRELLNSHKNSRTPYVVNIFPLL